jgi:hypothetical protein
MRISTAKLADILGPVVSWPTHLHLIADELAAANPSFNKEKFLRRATEKWEEVYATQPMDDYIPY